MKLKLLMVLIAISVVLRPGIGISENAVKSGPLQNLDVGTGALDLGASLRLRYENLDQYNVRKYGTGVEDSVLLGRIRLDVRYRLNGEISFFLQGQDARFWLSDDIHNREFPKSSPYYNDFDLRQAYMEWHTIGNSPIGVKMGRQAISYGDNRIFGPGDWGNVGRYTWDAAKLLWESDVLDADLIFGKRVLYLWDQFDDAHYDDEVLAVYARIKSFRPYTHDIFFIRKQNSDKHAAIGESGIGDLLVQSIGYQGKGGFHQIDYTVGGVYQFGDFGEDHVSAFGINTEVGVTFPHPLKPRIKVGLVYGSGDNDPNDGEHNTFDGVFGAVDKYYGRMNLFAWMNLVDWYAGVSTSPVKGMLICFDTHWFQLAEKRDAWYFSNGKTMRRDESGSSGNRLGVEMDLVSKYRVNSFMEIMVGGGIFLPNTFIEKTGTSETARWIFTQVELRI